MYCLRTIRNCFVVQVAASALLLTLSANAPAITINLLNTSTSPGPAIYEGEGNLDNIMQAAASYWSTVIKDDEAVTLFYGWNDSDSKGRTNPLAFFTTMEFGASRSDWFLDATPLDNSEYNFARSSYSNYSGQDINTGRTMTGGVNIDLFTNAVHEMGHALGFNSLKHPFLGDSIEITSPLPFAGIELPVEYGSGLHFTSSLENSLMYSGAPEGERRLPSQADIVAVAQAGGFDNVELGAAFVAGNTQFFSLVERSIFQPPHDDYVVIGDDYAVIGGSDQGVGVLDGGYVNYIRANLALGLSPGVSGFLTISGPGTELRMAGQAPGGEAQNGDVFVGVEGNGRLRVENGGVLRSLHKPSHDLHIGLEGGGRGNVEIDRNSAIEGFARVYVNNGILDVRKGSAITPFDFGAGYLGSGTVYINNDGTLKGCGAINAYVRQAGGTIKPGCSPSTLTITGDLIASSGVIEFEIEGGLRDAIEVLGDVIIGDEVVFKIYMDIMQDIINIDDFFTNTKPIYSSGFTADNIFLFSANPEVFGSDVEVAFGGNIVTRSIAFGSVKQIPEPSVWVNLLLGIAVMAVMRRCRRQERIGSPIREN